MIVTNIENKGLNGSKVFGNFVVIAPEATNSAPAADTSKKVYESVEQKSLNKANYVFISFASESEIDGERPAALEIFGDVQAVAIKGFYKVFNQAIERPISDADPEEPTTKRTAIKHIIVDPQTAFRDADSLLALLKETRTEEYDGTKKNKKRTIFFNIGDHANEISDVVDFIALNLAVDQFELNNLIRAGVDLQNDLDSKLSELTQIFQAQAASQEKEGGAIVPYKLGRQSTTREKRDLILQNLTAFEFDNIRNLIREIESETQQLQKSNLLETKDALSLLENLFKLSNWQQKLQPDEVATSSLYEEKDAEFSSESLVLKLSNLEIRRTIFDNDPDTQILFTSLTFVNKAGEEKTISGDYSDLSAEKKLLVVQKLCEYANNLVKQKKQSLFGLANFRTMGENHDHHNDHGSDYTELQLAIAASLQEESVIATVTTAAAAAEPPQSTSLFERVQSTIRKYKTLRGLANQLFDDCFKTNEEESNPNITDRGSIIFEKNGNQRILKIKQDGAETGFVEQDIMQGDTKAVIGNILHLGYKFSQSQCASLLGDCEHKEVGDVESTASSRTRRTLPQPPASPEGPQPSPSGRKLPALPILAAQTNQDIERG